MSRLRHGRHTNPTLDSKVHFLKFAYSRPGLGLDSWVWIPAFKQCVGIPAFGFLGLDFWVWIPGFGFLGLDLGFEFLRLNSLVWISGF